MPEFILDHGTRATKFVRFTLKNTGDPIWVRPDAISSVQCIDYEIRICMINGDVHVVEETYEDAQASLNLDG